MVGVKGDGGVILGGNCHREGLAHHISEIDSLANVQILGAGKLGDLNGDDRIGIGLAVSLFGHQVHIHDLTDFQIRNCLVKALDHHARAAYEFQRLSAVIGGIELCAIIKGSPVVDLDVLADIPAFHPGLAVSAAASAAFTVSAAALVIVIVVMAAAALVVLAVSALMAFAVVMVVAVRAGIDQVASQISFHSLIRAAGSARADFDPRIGERIESASAKTAADQYLDILVSQKARQRAVSDATRSDHFARHYFAILYLIYFKILSSSEMLEDIAVFIGCCNFHNNPFLKLCSKTPSFYTITRTLPKKGQKLRKRAILAPTRPLCSQ